MLQCVPEREALASVFKDYGNIRAFLKEKSPDPTQPTGIEREARDDYVKELCGVLRHHLLARDWRQAFRQLNDHRKGPPLPH